jgi:hypothetical protein
MRRLRRGVHDRCRSNGFNQSQNAVAIANIDLVMFVVGDLAAQTFERPGSVSIRAKENRALIIVDTNDRISSVVKMNANLRTDQSTRSCHQNALLCHELLS